MTKCSEASVTPEAAATGSETNATEKCFRERFGRLSCWSVVGCFRTEAGDRVHLLRIRRSPRKKPRVTYVRRVSDRWSRDTKTPFYLFKLKIWTKKQVIWILVWFMILEGFLNTVLTFHHILTFSSLLKVLKVQFVRLYPWLQWLFMMTLLIVTPNQKCKDGCDGITMSWTFILGLQLVGFWQELG